MISKLEPTLAAAALLLGTALLPPGPALSAQETKPGKEAVKPVLTVKTTDMEVAMAMIHAFESEAAPPDIQENMHYVVHLDSKGDVKASSGQGNVGWLDAVLHPGEFMALYAEEIDQNWQMAEATAIMALVGAGLTTKDAAKIMKATFEAPKQIQAVHIRFSTQPWRDMKNLSLSMSFTPTPGSWFGKLVKALRPSSQGAPIVDAKDPFMKIRMAIQSEGLEALAAPFFELAAGIGTKNRKQREMNLTIYHKAASFQDGTFAAAGNPFSGEFRSFAGLRDAAGMQELSQKKEYAEMAQAVAKMSPMVDTEYEAKAFTHRDIPVSKIIVTVEMDSPMVPAGDRITYSAVAGDYIVQTTGMSKDDSRKALDLALDQKIKRAPLPGNALMTMQFKFSELLDMAMPFGGNPFGDEGGPEIMDLRVTSGLDKLSLELTFR